MAAYEGLLHPDCREASPGNRRGVLSFEVRRQSVSTQKVEFASHRSDDRGGTRDCGDARHTIDRSPSRKTELRPTRSSRTRRYTRLPISGIVRRHRDTPCDIYRYRRQNRGEARIIALPSNSSILPTVITPEPLQASPQYCHLPSIISHTTC